MPKILQAVDRTFDDPSWSWLKRVPGTVLLATAT
jgi:hypothetical protein